MRTIAGLFCLMFVAFPLFAQNPGFENGLAGWTAAGSGSWSVNSTTPFIRSGARSIALTTSSSTTDGTLSDTSHSVAVPSSGTRTITVIAWVYSNATANAVTVGAFEGSTEYRGAEVAIPSGTWTRVAHSFTAPGGAICIPRLYGRSPTGTEIILYYDDVVICSSCGSVADTTSPAPAMRIDALPAGTQIALSWMPGVDNAGGSGVDGVLILRRNGVVAAEQSVQNQTAYSASDPLVGPTTVGAWKVVYNGTQPAAFTDDPGLNGIYTYLVFMRDSAGNYTSGSWAGARIFVFNGTGLSGNTQVNTRLDGLYLPATCTLSSDPASTVTIRAGASITVQGSMINHGNIYVRSGDVPPAQVTFAGGSVYDFNRNGTSTGAEFFSLIQATWLPGSTCKVTGVTNLFPLGLDQAFANLTWDCPSQSLTDTLGTSIGPTIVNGAFMLLNTGTGGVRLSSVPGPNRFRGDCSIIGGTLDAGGGADPVFDGSSPQHVSATGGVITGALSATVDNPSGLVLGSNLSLTTLTLTNGVVSTGANTLTIVPGGTVHRTNGHVAGFLRKHALTGSPSLIFEMGDAARYAPVTIALTNVVTPGELTASTTLGDHPNIGSSGLNPALTVNRYYSVANSGVVFDTATVTLHFDPLDLDPSVDTQHLVVRKYDAPAWSRTGNGPRTGTSTVAERITSFSDFAVGEGTLLTISSTASPGGTISPSGAVVVVEGDNQEFHAEPAAGYRLDSLVVDGVNRGAITTWTFVNVNENHAIAAYFSPNAHVITATAGVHGTLLPSGSIVVIHSGTQSFTITPDTGCRIDSVVVDGVNKGGIGTWTFTNVVTDHAISAYFSVNVYTITATAGPNGTIAPLGAVPVDFGGAQEFTISADPGYHVDSVLVDGVDQGRIGTYTFTNVTANHAIAAYFSLNVYTITATAFGHGTITPSGTIPVNHGGGQSFTITPAVYCHADSVVVDGVNQGVIFSYVFSAVTSDHAIAAHFTIDTIRFLSMTPDTVFNEEPVRVGRSKRPVPRGKGRYPNWSNLLDETVVQGGFAPGSSESDSAGGAVIGISHMIRGSSDPQNPRWKPNRDSTAVRAWVRLSDWSFRRGVGRGIVATRSRSFQKTLGDRSGKHTGQPRGLSTYIFGSEQRMHGQYRALAPKKHNNRLLAELVALKLNIAASQLGKTPPGFGELLFEMNGNPLDGMSVRHISQRADTVMTYWQGHTQAEYDSVWSALHNINRAFAGSLDTLRFERPDAFWVRGTLVLKGHVTIGDVPFLTLPVPFVPTRLEPISNSVESQEEFGEEEEGEEMEGDAMPTVARLYQNYPNPFNPATTIGFRLREPSLVTIQVFTLLGEEVGVLASDEEFDEGYNTVEFDAQGLSSGVYFYRIVVHGRDGEGQTSIDTRKMIYLR